MIDLGKLFHPYRQPEPLSLIGHRKLGAQLGTHDPRTVALGAYASGLTPPPEVHLSHEVNPWPMLGNDKAGCCVLASAGHSVLGWAAQAKVKASVTTEQVIAAYSAITGYDPNTHANDAGTDPTVAANYWRQTGIAGNKLGAFASVRPQDALNVKRAVAFFGGYWLALALPVSAQTQTGTLWDVPRGGATGQGAPNSWGGHMVRLLSYDSRRLAVVTWGQIQLLTWRFLGTYGDQGFALLDAEMLNPKSGKSPQGFNAQQLLVDLPQLGAVAA